MSGVRPEFRHTGGKISLNCEAGQIDFVTKNHLDLYRFRDRYLNRFTMLTEQWNENRGPKPDFFSLYAEIRENFRVSYHANLRTRLRAFTRRSLSAI